MIFSLLFLAAQQTVYAVPTPASTSLPASTGVSQVLETTSSCDELDKRLRECARKCFTSANLSVGLSTCNKKCTTDINAQRAECNGNFKIKTKFTS